MTTDKRFCVYRFYDGDDRLLYVGRTCRFGVRMAGHRKAQDWWLEVDRIQVEHVGTLQESIDLEAEQIAELRPAYNIRLQPGPVVLDSGLSVSGMERLMLSAELCERLGRDAEWLEGAHGEGVPRVYLRGAGFRYRLSDVKAWLAR